MRFEKCPISVPLIIISIYLVIYIQEISCDERTDERTNARQKNYNVKVSLSLGIARDTKMASLFFTTSTIFCFL